MENNKRYISLKKATEMEDSIGFLSHYTGPHLHGQPWGGENVVGNSLTDIDQEATDKLKRLGEINKEREELLNWFKSKA